MVRELRICSCLACVYRVRDVRGKFGEHEKCVRVARGAAESNSSFFSALQTSQVHPQLDIRTAKSMNKFFYNRATTRICAKKHFIMIKFSNSAPKCLSNKESFIHHVIILSFLIFRDEFVKGKNVRL